MKRAWAENSSTAMYGTRDAAQNWEYAYTSFMVSLGVRKGVSTPCAFHHPEKGIRAVAHGDDFTLLGTEREQCWFIRGN